MEVVEPEEPIPTWEIVLTRTIATDPGDCQPEYMDTAAHISAKGIFVYAMHYKDLEGDGLPPADLERKLVREVAPDEEPAKTIIATVNAKKYFQYVEHPTYSIGAPLPEDCSKESATIHVETPSSTGIITLVQEPSLPQPEGMAAEIYELLDQYL